MWANHKSLVPILLNYYTNSIIFPILEGKSVIERKESTNNEYSFVDLVILRYFVAS